MQTNNRSNRFHPTSMLFGALFAASGFAMLGAAANDDDSSTTIVPQRFLVLVATPMRNPANPEQSIVQLKVSPHYGKIDQEGLRFRLENESQELTVLIAIEKAGKEFRRGDIISFAGFTHIQFAPGSQTVRHLPGGGAELVP